VRTYDQPEAGEWVQPVRHGYKMACCGCGLVHRLDFRALRVGRLRRVVIQFRVFLDRRATAAMRRERRKRGEPTP